MMDTVVFVWGCMNLA